MHASELELVKRCQRGDLSAFDQLMVLYEKKVYSLCFRMSGNADDAADLAQEIFLKVFRALPSFKGQSSFSTWLFRIATNTCLDQKRRLAGKPQVSSLDKPLATEEGELEITLPGNEPDPQDLAVQSELQQEIQQLLGKLPKDMRIALVLRDLEGYSYEEIAELLNISLGTVKSRINRARSRLRDFYVKKQELLQKQEQKQQKLHLKEQKGVGA